MPLMPGMLPMSWCAPISIEPVRIEPLPTESGPISPIINISASFGVILGLAPFAGASCARPGVATNDANANAIANAKARDFIGFPSPGCSAKKRRLAWNTFPHEASEAKVHLHIFDDRLAELGALEQLRPGHQALEVVGDRLVRDRAAHPADNRIARLLPSHMLEHQHAREDNRAGIDLVLVRVLRRGAVGRLENRMTRHVVDIRARRDSDSANLRGERVGEVVAV